MFFAKLAADAIFAHIGSGRFACCTFGRFEAKYN